MKNVLNNVVNLVDFKARTVELDKKDKTKELELICDEVLALWTVNFHADMIDEMLCDRLNISFLEYTKDLNAISDIEKSFGVSFITFGPGTTDNEYGYVCGIKLPNGQIIATPEMMTENLARMFGILFYNELLVQEYLP